jgi:DNA-binding transcriptional ArsR family regulator
MRRRRPAGSATQQGTKAKLKFKRLIDRKHPMSRAAASSDAYHAIADGNRRALLDLLREQERPVGDLVAATGLSYALVSQHLRVLLEASVVERRPDGRQRIYRLDARPIAAVHAWASGYEGFWADRFDRLRRQLDR